MRRDLTFALVLLGFAMLGCDRGVGIGTVKSIPIANPNVSQANFEKLSEGMTHEQIEQVLGSGTLATPTEIDRIQPALSSISDQRNYKLKEVANQGRCYVWSNAPHYIVIVYNKPPANGGTMTYGTFIRYTEAPDGSRECENLVVEGLL